jgi:uncharacterized membrane protein YoaK (UPF0700 family)
MLRPVIQRRRHALIVLLTLNSGATDAFGFLALGGAFTSVMTGNLVLLGIGAGRADNTLAIHAAGAVICFILGCVLGTRMAGTAVTGQALWPMAVTRALAVELGLISAQAIGWWVTRTHPSGGVQLALLAANAVALGIQSSAVQRFGESGLSTTYMTGTLTTLVVRLTSGHRVRDLAGSIQLLLALVVGAIAMSLLRVHLPVAAPLLQLGCLIFVLIGARSLRENELVVAEEVGG